MKNPPKKHRLKDLNWNAVTEVFLIIIGAALGALLIAFLFSSCQKEVSSLNQRVIESDHGLKPAGGYSLTKRDVTPELLQAAKKGGTKGPKGKPTQPPADTTTNPPPPPVSSSNVLYLDFDGEAVNPQYWNAGTVSYSGLTATEIDSVVARIKREYEPMGFTVTTDRAVYDAAPVGHRHMTIYTESWSWYGQAGGVAYIGSYKWDAPSFVFTSLLSYNAKYIADAGVHEAGHAFGLRHILNADGSYATYGNYEGVSYYVDRGFFERNVKDATGVYVDQIAKIQSNL
jgi:hypothetical protein